MCFWFNTLFVGSNNILELKRDEIDKAAKDKHGKVFKDGFKLQLCFDTMDDSASDSKSEIRLSSTNLLSQLTPRNSDKQEITALTDKYPSLRND